jgi:hypothetical protein
MGEVEGRREWIAERLGHISETLRYGHLTIRYRDRLEDEQGRLWTELDAKKGEVRS